VGILLAAYCLITYLAPLETRRGALLGPCRFTLGLSLADDYMARRSEDLMEVYCSQPGFPCPDEPMETGGLAPGLTLPPPSELIPLTIGAAALQIALVWLGVWGWMRWQQR